MSFRTFTSFIACVALLGCGASGQSPETFTFIVNADPQMGEADSKNRGIQQLNGLLEDFVANVNDMRPEPSFVVFNGDLVAFPRADSFANFVRLVKPLQVPTKLVHGNHDGRYPDQKFLDAQETLSGQRELQYSFDLGRWHFVALPAPEMTPKPEQKAALLKWLSDDLAANADRPVMVFMHYHVLPVGLSQLEYYTLEMGYKRELVEALAAPGNVKYVISGHVHAGVKASIKMAWHYRGINFVIAPSPVWPRAFGDEFPKFLEGGDGENVGYYLEVAIDGDEATLFGRKINTDLRRRYPDTFTEFTEELDPRAFTTLAETDPAPELVNGDFEKGLDGWLAPYRYCCSSPKGFVRRTAANAQTDGQAAYLRVRPNGTAWTFDESDEIYQVIRWNPTERPLVRLDYRVPREGHTPFGGGYVRITAFSGQQRVLTELFHWGTRENRVRHLPQIFDYIATGDEFGLAKFHRRARNGESLSWETLQIGAWRPLQINVATLYENGGKKPRVWHELQADRLVIAIGVWTGFPPDSGGAVWVDNVELSNADGEPTILGAREAVMSPRARQAPYGGYYLDRLAN